MFPFLVSLDKRLGVVVVVVAVVSILAYGVVLGSAFDETVSWESVSALSRDWYCNRSSIWLGHR